MAQPKLTIEQAALEAFRACRLNHDKSKAVCKYLTIQYLISSGHTPTEAAGMLTPEIEQTVLGWYDQREQNPAFSPSV